MADSEIDGAGTQPAAPPPRRGGTFAPFRYPAFRAIWTANLASNLGSTIQAVGAAWLMTDLTDSHRLVALVQASSTLPILLFGLFAGAIADNYDRRRVMLAAQGGMLVVSVALALLTVGDFMTPFLLLALTLGVGTGTALNLPAWQASVRQQVGLADLPQAIALNGLSMNLARSVGPALGGLLIAIWSVAAAFAVNAASYVALIFVLLRWRPEQTRGERKPMLEAIGIALRFCAQSSPVRRVLMRGLALGFGIAGYHALIPAVVRDLLHGHEVDFGLLLTTFGVSSILAALSLARLRRYLGIEAMLALGVACFVFAQSLLAAVTSVSAALPAMFAAGIGWVVTFTSLNVAMQLRSPEHILGRCLAIYQAVTYGGLAVGAWAWGALADWRSLPFALHAAAAFLVICSVLLRLFAPMPTPGEGRVDG